MLGLLFTAGIAFHWAEYAALPGYLAWFAAGMGLAVASVRLAGRERATRWTRFVMAHPDACWALALAIYLGIAFSTAFPRLFDGRAYTPLAHTVEHVLYAAVALLVMLPAVFGEAAGGSSRRLLASRSLSQLGVVSYGIFLWQVPLMDAFGKRGAMALIPGWPVPSLLIVAVPAVVACAWLSHRWIERPAMRLRSRSI
jgi:peptidoglycan/LPS O-acetylase OafA/YrhL